MASEIIDCAPAFTGDAVYVRVKDISSGQEVYVALGAWDTIGVLKKRLEGKGMGPYDMQVSRACYKCEI